MCVDIYIYSEEKKNCFQDADGVRKKFSLFNSRNAKRAFTTRHRSSHLTFTMATVVGAGGVMGYVKGRSVPSLAAGLIFGGIFAASGYMINNGREVAGFRTGLHTSALLAGVMGARFIKSRKVMPAGALAALSLISSGYHGKKYVEWAEVELED